VALHLADLPLYTCARTARSETPEVEIIAEVSACIQTLVMIDLIQAQCIPQNLSFESVQSPKAIKNLYQILLGFAIWVVEGVVEGVFGQHCDEFVHPAFLEVDSGMVGRGSCTHVSMSSILSRGQGGYVIRTTH
jgi:hypothetical protein